MSEMIRNQQQVFVTLSSRNDFIGKPTNHVLKLWDKRHKRAFKFREGNEQFFHSSPFLKPFHHPHRLIQF